MVWLPLQNFPIAALRVCQFFLPMQHHSLTELGLQCRRSRLLCLPLGITYSGIATSNGSAHFRSSENMARL
jgi:hypothetical protein